MSRYQDWTTEELYSEAAYHEAIQEAIGKELERRQFTKTAAEMVEGDEEDESNRKE